MEIGNKLLSITLFIIIAFVILNQLIKLSVFAYKYYNNYIMATINKMSCGNYFNETEHPRFQISKNIYDLHIDNDIFNSKTYIIIIYIFSIIFYIYAFNTLVSAFDDDTFDKKFEYTYIIIGLLALLTLVYFITIIAVRFDGGDDKGYKTLYAYNFSNDNNSYNKHVLESAFYSIIAFLIAIQIGLIFIYNRDKLEPGIFIYLPYIAAFYVFTLYFMNNLLNIVLSFKNNEYPLKEGENSGINDLNDYYGEKNPNAIYNNIDISYGNENYFYRKYLEYSKIDYFDIFKDIHDIQKIGYKEATSYNISNLKDSNAIYTGGIRNFILAIILIMTCAVLLYGLGSVIPWLVDISGTNYLNYNYERIKKYAILIARNIILPLFILLIVIFIIVATMEYNTMINKNILIDINKKYKEDLNNLNNSLLPVLYEKNKELTNNTDVIKYSYVIYNVMTSYLLNTINLFDITSKKENTSTKDSIKTITTTYKINDTKSPYSSNYNITKDKYDYKYDISTENISSLNIKKEINYNNEIFNTYVNTIEGIHSDISDIDKDKYSCYLKEDTDKKTIVDKTTVKDKVFNIDEIKKIYNNIFINNNKTFDVNIKNNIKNNILCSMYNIDNYKNKTGDDKVNFFRNYIFKKNPDKDIHFNEFLLKANLDNTGMNFEKYNIYIEKINTIINNFIDELIILNTHVPNYDKLINQGDIDHYKTTIKKAFGLLKSELKGSLDTMIKEFSESNSNNNILFKNIENNYKRANIEEKVELKAYDISTKFTNPETINKDSKNFDTYLIKAIKDHKNEIDLLKGHDDIVKNANFVINERLYVLISTYLISLFIAYKLVKN